MQRWEGIPTWMNRLTHSLCSVLSGTVLGAALFARSRFADAIVPVVTGFVVIYWLAWLFVSIRWLASTRNARA